MAEGNVIEQAKGMFEKSPIARVFHDGKEQIFNAWKQGDMQSMSRMLRDETIKRLEDGRKSLNNAMMRFKNNITATEAIDALGAVDTLITTLVNEVRNEEFGYGRIGDKYAVTLDNLQRTLDYDGQIVGRVEELMNSIKTMETVGDDGIAALANDAKAALAALRRDLADRPNIMKGVV